MDLGLTGKRVLVTGASAGLGAAAAMALAAEGAAVVINGRDLSRLETTAGKIESRTGAKPGLAVGDVSKSPDRVKVINSARDQLRDGVVDILVSNTGGPPPGAFLDQTGDTWREAGQLLVDSAVGMTRAFLPGMIEQNWGRLIYITSVAVLQPLDDLILSNSYRAAVTGFCKTISNNYAKHGITANCVCPGYTATERLMSLAESRAQAKGTTAKDELRAFSGQVPAGRLGRPEELAALIAFLASDQAAYITGSSIAVDGGVHRALF
jgi:3-oxoacyl-[acyl-carrier protein] reductase